MTLELVKRDRIPFPMGIMALDVHVERNTAYAACMDGIYECFVGDRGEDDKPKPKKIGAHESYVSGISYSKINQTLVTASYDGTLHIRDIPNEPTEGEIEPRIKKRIHDFWSWDMSMSPDGRFVVSVTGQYLAGSEDYSPLPAEEPCVRIVDARTGEILHSLDMLPSVQCVAIDPSSRFVAAANLMGDIAVWEMDTGKQISTWRTPSFTSWGIIKSHCYIGGIYAVSFSPDGEHLYAAGMGEMNDPMAGNGKQRWQRFAWKQTNVEKQMESKPDQTGEGLMEVLAWHPTGDYFAMAGRLRGGNWNIGLFSRESGDLIGQAKTGMRITSVHFHPDGKTLLLAGMQGQPKPKEGVFPAFGYLERYEISTVKSTEDAKS
jgi:WD40 repeat protein